jgi:signal transduction histidine kinase
MIHLGETISDTFSLKAVKAQKPLIRHDHRILHFAVPVTLGDKKLATLQIGFHTAEIKSTIEKLNQNISRLYYESYNTTLVKIILFSLVITLFGLLTALLSTNGFIKPIHKLVHYFKKFEEGQYGLQLNDGMSDEMGDLIQAFNRMSRSLKQTTVSKDELENIVRMRTTELAETNSALEKEITIHEETQKSLKLAKEDAENANRAKSDFLANMSHELRTPLNHIIGFTELVIGEYFGDLNNQQKEYLKDVLGSSKHLLSLINDILDLSKVEAGKLVYEPSTVFLREILENSTVMIKEKAIKNNIRLSTDLDGIPDTITADERKLKQIIYNLLSNAVKFTPENGQICLTGLIIASSPNKGL